MTRSLDIGWIVLYCWVLLAIVTSISAEALHTLPRPTSHLTLRTLKLDCELSWQEIEESQARCFTAHIPTSGTWWIEVTSSTPSTAPEMLFFAPPREALGDATSAEAVTLLERIHSVVVAIHQPGDYAVCLTSQVPLGDVRIRNVFVDESSEGGVGPKGGDPLELELEEDPFRFEPEDGC